MVPTGHELPSYITQAIAMTYIVYVFWGRIENIVLTNFHIFKLINSYCWVKSKVELCICTLEANNLKLSGQNLQKYS